MRQQQEQQLPLPLIVVEQLACSDLYFGRYFDQLLAKRVQRRSEEAKRKQGRGR